MLFWLSMTSCLLYEDKVNTSSYPLVGKQHNYRSIPTYRWWNLMYICYNDCTELSHFSWKNYLNQPNNEPSMILNIYNKGTTVWLLIFIPEAIVYQYHQYSIYIWNIIHLMTAYKGNIYFVSWESLCFFWDKVKGNI